MWNLILLNDLWGAMEFCKVHLPGVEAHIMLGNSSRDLRNWKTHVDIQEADDASAMTFLVSWSSGNNLLPSLGRQCCGPCVLGGAPFGGHSKVP